jgi:hypothetical protein
VTATKVGVPDEDEGPLRAAVEALGVSAQVWAWDDPSRDWSSARLCVLRSPWNYIDHYDRFLAWVDHCARASALWNSAEVVRWNSHKRYLVELGARGLPVVPTRLVPRGTRVALETLVEDWPEVVVKPAVAAGSFGALRVARASLAAGQAHLDGLGADRDMLVQPYMTSVAEHGERAVVWLDGAFSHEVRKSPRFAGQPAEISRAQPVGAPEREAAARILAAVPHDLLYARIDLARDAEGRPQLMELELVEPRLFLDQPAALAAFAGAIVRRLR